MATIPQNMGRVSLQFRNNATLTNLRSSSLSLLELQEQMSTGKRVNRPSQDMTVTYSVATLRGKLEKASQVDRNLQVGGDYVDNTDEVLRDILDALQEAQGLASEQVGITSDAGTRRNMAAVVDTMISRLFETANRRYLDIPLLGGERTGVDPFVEQFGGIRYVGATENLELDLGLNRPLGVNSNGAEALGGLSDRIKGNVNLNPDLTLRTLIGDLNGAQGRGIEKGVIQLVISDGVTEQIEEIDLSNVNTVEDVLNQVNAVVNEDVTRGELTIDGPRFALTSDPGWKLTLRDVQPMEPDQVEGEVAKDFGLRITSDALASVDPVTVNGRDTDPRVTLRTELAAVYPPRRVEGDATNVVVLTESRLQRIREMDNLSMVVNGKQVAVPVSDIADVNDLNSRIQQFLQQIDPNGEAGTISVTDTETYVKVNPGNAISINAEDGVPRWPPTWGSSLVSTEEYVQMDTQMDMTNPKALPGLKQLSPLTLRVDGEEYVGGVDISGANSLSELQQIVNNAIATIDPEAGGVEIIPDGIRMRVNAGHTIFSRGEASVPSPIITGPVGLALEAPTTDATDGGSSPTALPPDPAMPAPVGPVPMAPGDPAVPGLSLGDILVTNGDRQELIDLRGATTVQDVIAKFNAADIGVRMVINEDATGLDVFNEISGTTMSIAEYYGTSATDLGIRTFNYQTKLTDFRGGLGINTDPGYDNLGQTLEELEFQLHDGTSFEVDVDGAQTVDDVLSRVKTAAALAGLIVGPIGALGSDFEVGLRQEGNGFEFIDNTTGANDFKVSSPRTNTAAELGIAKNAGAGKTLSGEDAAAVQTDSVFTHLMALRDGLLNNDTQAITRAGSKIADDIERVANVRGIVGVRSKRVSDQVIRAYHLQAYDEILLSDEQDADLADVVTNYNELQQQLMANYRSSAIIQDLNLMDFLS